MAESLITSVPNHEDEAHFPMDDDDDDGFEGEAAIPKILHLDIRGTRRDLDRDTVRMMPNSLLMTLFPNGLVLGPQRDDDEEDDDDDSIGRRSTEHVFVTFVDFDPKCFDYVVHFFETAQAEQQEELQQDPEQIATPSSGMMMPSSFKPFERQGIIFLREELEYFCIPSQPKLTQEDIDQLKFLAGKHLEQQDTIFEALQKSIARENNVAEKHLIDMLCDAGFSRDDRWGYRALEPKTTCLVSIGLVHLKTTSSDNHMPVAEKLMLFYRKPARKCWWDGSSANLEGQAVRLWARRTWTLELALV